MRLQNHSGEFSFRRFHFHMSVQCREEESECRWMLMFWCFGFICYMGSYLCIYELLLRRSLAMLEGHSFSYKVVFSLLIAVYSLG